MFISTETGSYERYGDNEDILRLLKESGFDAYDYTMIDFNRKNNFITADDYLERARKLREFADGIGIVCNQSHAPFPTALKGNEKYNSEIFPFLVRAIEICGILGGKVCVIHPCNNYSAEQNREIYAKLLPVAERCNVIIGTENMWNWDREKDHAVSAACSSHEDFKRHLDLIDSPYFTACLDIGHAEMRGLETSAVQMIRTIGKKLGALHIHDNDRHHDSHAIPYTHEIDFEAIIDALAEVNYSGDITFEADRAALSVPVALIPATAKYIHEIGVYLRTEVEKRKK